MQIRTDQHTQSIDDTAAASPAAPHGLGYERPSVEEISLCCEISAYAPDGDDRPLF